jgi:hypothetical protein
MSALQNINWIKRESAFTKPSGRQNAQNKMLKRLWAKAYAAPGGHTTRISPAKQPVRSGDQPLN